MIQKTRDPLWSRIEVDEPFGVGVGAGAVTTDTKQVKALVMSDLFGEVLRDWTKGMHKAFPSPIVRAGGAEPEEPLPVEEASDPIVGWRYWRLAWALEEVLLRSPLRGTLWWGPILRAEEGPPAERGRDGIYAHRDAADVSMHNSLIRRPLPDDWSGVLGRVELTGRVIEHERGYRAEHARITMLLLDAVVARSRDGRKIQAQLEARYRCRVTFDTLEFYESEEEQTRCVIWDDLSRW